MGKNLVGKKISNKVRESRCDENANHLHKMKVHDGMNLRGYRGRTYGCQRKGLEVVN